MMTTEPLTNTELAERRVQQLAAALDYWRERAEAAEAKLAAQQTAACPHCGKPLAGQKPAPF